MVRSSWRRALVVASLLYAGALTTLAALWALAPGRLWWADVASVFAAHAFAPLLALVPLALVTRSPWMRGAVALLLVLFLALFGERFVPRIPPPSSGQPSIRVATFNTWRTNEHPGEAVELLLAHGADVILLQELSYTTVDVLRQQLSSAYPYQILRYNSELGILSRYPIVDTGTLKTVRGQWATLQLEDRNLAVVNVHLHRRPLNTRALPGVPGLRLLRGYDSSAQQAQIHQLLRELEPARLPFILAGDFNIPDRDPIYPLLANRLTDVYRAAATGFGFTYPDQRRVGPFELTFPVLRLDYIWSTKGIVPTIASVECGGGSDHCMVVADLRLDRVGSYERPEE
jgi:endonuclease/exonuclease/phosphatase (EEP) superfamily protein YafD